MGHLFFLIIELLEFNKGRKHNTLSDSTWLNVIILLSVALVASFENWMTLPRFQNAHHLMQSCIIVILFKIDQYNDFI